MDSESQKHDGASFLKILLHAFPCILAILISGVIDIEISINHPFTNYIGKWIGDSNVKILVQRITWGILQLIPSFVYGWWSDTHMRKKVFIGTQIIGVVACVAILLFEVNWLVFIVLGILYNPMTVARAAMLDNFPKLSAVKVIAITFMAKNLFWIFIEPIISIPLETAFLFILPIQVLNLIFVWKLFHDRYEDKDEMKKFLEMEEKHIGNHLKENRWPIALMICALSLSETTFYLLWNFLETDSSMESWLSLTSLGTYFGLLFTLLYRKVPHLSLISILYASGCGMMLITLIYSFQYNLSYALSLTYAMVHFCIIGGIYLPFVADSIILLSGSTRKATGSAIYEIGDTVALLLAAIATIFLINSAYMIIFANVLLYALATIFQKISERSYTSRLSRVD